MSVVLKVDVGSTARTDTQSAPQQSGPNPLQAPGQSECVSHSWYVVRHRPYEGTSTCNAIKEIGFKARHFVERISRPRRDDVLRAFLPGYLFARWSMDDPQWGRILRLRGVVGVMSTSSGHPIAVPIADMDLFGSRFDDRDELIPIKKAAPSDVIGKQFSVQVGPWAKFIGECVGIDPKGRVALLLTIFGRDSIQEFSPKKIKAVDAT